jgi:hypothetical protein
VLRVSCLFLKNSNDKINLFNLGCDTSTNVNRIAQYVVEEMCLNGVKFKYSGVAEDGQATYLRCDSIAIK